MFKIRTCAIQKRHICAKEGGVTFVSSQYLGSRDLSKHVDLEEAGFVFFFYADNHYLFSFTLLEQFIVGGGGEGRWGSEHALTLRIKPTQKLNLFPIYFLFYVGIK